MMPQDAREVVSGSALPDEAVSSPGEDPLADYAWRERGLGVASPLTWAQKRSMRQLITQGKAEALPIGEQRCWVSCDMRWLLAGATRVIIKPSGKRVLR